ncbi:hypothetical protein [Ruegeria sp.]|uniref:hypothetical protein n=1 Tax=Ruegeria sp. TaxID=1879320 RepID=UPI00232097D9|nr:hypothetical protein [Ruegeria sp.]MDA7963751.1 hypothetical protein [Ruegeria sp.]
MLGWKIFAHSVRMVFGNLQQVLQITVGPALIGAVAIVAIFMALGIPPEVFETSQTGFPEGVSTGSFLMFLFSAIAVILVIMFWIAVSWHRFILLEEYPSGILPTFRFDRILAYFGRLLLLGLMLIIGYFPAGMVLSAVGGGLALGLIIIYVLFLLVCFYRLSIILPAAAIGHPITLAEAWNSTRETGGAILLMLLVAFVFQLIVQFLFTLLAFIPILGPLLSVFLGTLVLPMINVSILTTMYGIFIEKRELT